MYENGKTKNYRIQKINHKDGGKIAKKNNNRFFERIKTTIFNFTAIVTALELQKQN